MLSPKKPNTRPAPPTRNGIHLLPVRSGSPGVTPEFVRGVLEKLP